MKKYVKLTSEIKYHLRESSVGLLISAFFFVYSFTNYLGHTAAGFIFWIPFLFDWNLKQLQKIRKEYRNDIEAVSKKIDNAIEIEKKQRILSFAKRASTGELPSHCILLITIHRTGSTWLMDAIRCHPFVRLEPTNIIPRAIGVTGGRYPKGLLNNKNMNVVDIEIAEDEGAQIPEFKMPTNIIDIAKGEFDRTYAIEKIHPSFVKDSFEALLEKVKKLEKERNINFKFIYQVRDPKSVFSSFLNYQQRDPTWYSTILEVDLPPLMVSAYKFILSMSKIRRGLIIDYSEIINNPKEVLLRVYRYLWPSSDQKVLSILVDSALTLTKRNKRLRNNSGSFLSKTPGPERGGDDQHLKFFHKYEEAITQIYNSYFDILDTSDPSKLGSFSRKIY